MMQHSRPTDNIDGAVAILFFMGLVFMVGMVLNFRTISRYNRKVFPSLYSDWAHTFMCRRCGKYSLIRP
jgi:hypothetical protein